MNTAASGRERVARLSAWAIGGLLALLSLSAVAAAPRALYASRTNTLLSIPMMYCMVSANLG